MTTISGPWQPAAIQIPVDSSPGSPWKTFCVFYFPPNTATTILYQKVPGWLPLQCTALLHKHCTARLHDFTYVAGNVYLALPAVSYFGGTARSRVFFADIPGTRFSKTEPMGK